MCYIFRRLILAFSFCLCPLMMMGQMYSGDLEKKAEEGDVESMNTLGYCLFHSQGIVGDDIKAAYWFRQAAEAGSLNAMCNLGYCYDTGRGVERDYVQAVAWYRKSAEQGYVRGMYDLAVCYDRGRGVECDFTQAVHWYSLAADKGEINAMNNLAVCYENGQGVELNYDEAFSWYHKAAQLGHVDAMYNLARCYETAHGTAKNYKEAVSRYRQAGKKGHVDAMYYLARCYEKGWGVDPDPVKAIRWYRKAAYKGKTIAILVLAKFFEEGFGVQPSIPKANLLHAAQQAAKRGNINDAEELMNCVFENFELQENVVDYPQLQIVPHSVHFSDLTGNYAVDAREKCKITFKLQNIGHATARDCMVNVSCTCPGIMFMSQNLPEIAYNETIMVEIPLEGSSNIETGKAKIAFSVYEPNDFGCGPITTVVGTQAATVH